MDFNHTSVLLNETIDMLNIKPDGIYADCTLGGGGHSYELLRRGGPGVRLIGIDRDRDALEAAKKRLAPFEGQVTYVHSNYSEIKSILSELGVTALDGCMLDLGVSSYQLDTPERGFSYMHDAPLDMRMDTDQFFSAYQVVNEYSQKELCRIIRDCSVYSGGKRARRHMHNRRACKHNKKSDTDQSAQKRIASGKKDISGDKDRGK